MPQMNAIIMEIKGKYGIAIDGRGNFIRFRNSRNLNVGDEIALSQRSFAQSGAAWLKPISAAAVLVFMLAGSFGVYAYNQPKSYVYMDINPGIELVVNRFDRVLSAYGTNNDGKELLTKIDYKNANLDDTIDSILDTAKAEGYFIPDQNNALVLTVAAKNEDSAQKLKEEISVKAKKHLETLKLETDVITDTVKMDRQQEALKQGINPGKLNLIQKLMEVDKEATVEKYKEAPVKDILKRTNELKKQQKEVKNKADDNKNKEKDHKVQKIGEESKGVLKKVNPQKGSKVINGKGQQKKSGKPGRDNVKLK